MEQSARLLRTAALVSALSLLPAAWAGAQDAGDTGASRFADRFSFNGFLSQAYGITDGNQILGIGEEGTASYHNLALQLRYQVADDHRFVLQLNHDKLGDSPVQELQDDVELDWLFYEYRSPGGFYLKAGRAPIPLGIYNEYRDVGTLLPFYSPPISIYFEDQFSNEHVDGLIVGHRFTLGPRWALSLDVYGGKWSLFESSSGFVAEAHADNALGAQLWLETPIEGLRFGVGANRYDVSGGLIRVDEKDRWETAIFSIDGDFERFLLRAELYRREVPVAFANGLSVAELKSDAYYVQAGYRFSPNWAVYVQVERGDVSFALPFVGELSDDFWKDIGLSLSYQTVTNIGERPMNLVFKAEIHDNEGYLIENENLSLFVNEAAETTYGLLSVAVAF